MSNHKLGVKEILNKLNQGGYLDEGGVETASAQLLQLLEDVAPEKKVQTKYLGKQHSFEQGWNNATQDYLAKIRSLFQ